MTVGVVIPAYNAENFLAKTVQSVLKQSYTNWELVIIDDGSKDRTFDISQEYADQDYRIRAVHQKNSGVALARNKGFSELSPECEALIFLDHDDLWSEDALETLVNALHENSNCVGAHGLSLPFAVESLDQEFATVDDLTPWRRRKVVRQFGFFRTKTCDWLEPTTFAIQIYNGCITTPGAMLARRSALEKTNLFDPTITPCDDWEMWLRLSVLGPTAYVKKIILNWRVHGGNASLNKSFMGHGVSQLRRKSVCLPNLNSEQRAMARWRYRRMYASVERHNAQDLVRWAAEELKAGKLNNGFKLLDQALQLYFHYLALVVCWGKEEDRGPIPERLADSRSSKEAANTP